MPFCSLRRTISLRLFFQVESSITKLLYFLIYNSLLSLFKFLLHPFIRDRNFIDEFTMDNQGTRSRSFASIDDNEMDLDPLPAAPAGSPNSYHCTTYLACTSIGSLMDVCGQETTLAVDHSYVQTGFEKKLIRRFKAKDGKKRSLCKKGCNL